jgi:hypothetical protein
LQKTEMMGPKGRGIERRRALPDYSRPFFTNPAGQAQQRRVLDSKPNRPARILPANGPEVKRP